MSRSIRAPGPASCHLRQLIGSVFGAAAMAGTAVRAGEPCEPHWTTPFPGGNLCQGAVRAFAIIDLDGPGTASDSLVAGGYFLSVGPACSAITSIGNVAAWDGQAWSPVGGGTGMTVHALAEFDDDAEAPNPPALFAGGDFQPAGGGVASRIAKWNGTSWQPLGSGVGNTVFALAVFDEDAGGPNPPALFAGGEFVTAGGMSIQKIARWNGSNWSAVGGGLPQSQVKALVVHDEDGDGPGPPALFAGREFLGGGNVDRWDGQAWTTVGEFGPGGVLALASVDHDGAAPGSNPPTLYAGGEFINHAGVTVNRIARYSGGTSWSGMDGGVLGSVFGLAEFDDDGETGSNPPALYAGGIFFNVAGGAIAASNIARWDGYDWSALDGGITGWNGVTYVRSLIEFHPGGSDPAPARFVAGGLFNSADAPANAHSSPNVALWAGCAPPGIPGDLDGDSLVNVVDLLALLGAWGPCPETCPPSCLGDVDEDCAVGIVDLLILLGNWT